MKLGHLFYLIPSGLLAFILYLTFKFLNFISFNQDSKLIYDNSDHVCNEYFREERQIVKVIDRKEQVRRIIIDSFEEFKCINDSLIVKKNDIFYYINSANDSVSLVEGYLF